MDEEFIDYGQLIDDAMHIIVRKALQIVQNRGLRGDHHFFISFITSYPGVELAKHLREKYSDEMTIVLQYQFEDLQVSEDKFSVLLSFGGVKERLVVPFAALTAFADPSVKFGLQFRSLDDSDFADEHDEYGDSSVHPDPAPKAFPSEKERGGKGKKDKSGSNVISMDHFRKK